MINLTPEQRWQMEVLLLTLPHPNQTPEQKQMVDRMLEVLRDPTPIALETIKGDS